MGTKPCKTNPLQLRNFAVNLSILKYRCVRPNRDTCPGPSSQLSAQLSNPVDPYTYLHWVPRLSPRLPQLG